MKKLIFILFLQLICNITLYAQDYSVGDLIKFKTSVPINNIMDNSTIINEESQTLNRLHGGIVFEITNIDGEYVSVIAIPFGKNSNRYEKAIIDSNTIINEYEKGSIVKSTAYENADLTIKSLANKNALSRGELYNEIIYKVNIVDFNKAYEKIVPFEKFTLGILSLPVKVRLQNKVTFDTHFNIGATVGVRLTNPLNPYAFYFQGGLNLGTTQLTSSNSNINIDSEESEDITAGVGSFIFGGMLQYKKIQAGIYLGVDFISNQKQYDWDYHGEPWLSLGIGVDVFQPKNVTIESQK